MKKNFGGGIFVEFYQTDDQIDHKSHCFRFLLGRTFFLSDKAQCHGYHKVMVSK